MPDAESVAWAPRAKQDLKDIWRYYARVASPDIADELLRRIGEASVLLGKRPLSWRRRDDVMPGLRSSFVHPYTIFYRVSGTTIEVARVVHQRRDLRSAFPKHSP